MDLHIVKIEQPSQLYFKIVFSPTRPSEYILDTPDSRDAFYERYGVRLDTPIIPGNCEPPIPVTVRKLEMQRAAGRTDPTIPTVPEVNLNMSEPRQKVNAPHYISQGQAMNSQSQEGLKVPQDSPEPPEISPITIDSDEDEPEPKVTQPVQQDVKMQDVSAMDPRLLQSQQKRQPAPMYAQPGVPPLFHPGTEQYVKDTVDTGLQFLHNLRTKDQGVDKALRSWVQLPLPTFPKPLVITTEGRIPDKLIDYFTMLYLHLNKNVPVICIWIDLYVRCDIYISFAKACELQLIMHDKMQKILPTVPGAIFQQPRSIQNKMLAHYASARLLHNWSKSQEGAKLINDMEMAVERKRSSDEFTADRMMEKLQYQAWLHYLDDDLGGFEWLKRVSQRHQ